MAKLRLMRAGYGDELLAEWEVGVDSPELRTARSRFDEAMSIGGRLAFRIDGPGRSEVIKAFEETANDILICPAVTGG